MNIVKCEHSREKNEIRRGRIINHAESCAYRSRLYESYRTVCALCDCWNLCDSAKLASGPNVFTCRSFGKLAWPPDISEHISYTDAAPFSIRIVRPYKFVRGTRHRENRRVLWSIVSVSSRRNLSDVGVLMDIRIKKNYVYIYTSNDTDERTSTAIRREYFKSIYRDSDC